MISNILALKIKLKKNLFGSFLLFYDKAKERIPSFVVWILLFVLTVLRNFRI